MIRRNGGFRRWGWHKGYTRRGLALLALAIAGWSAYYAARPRVFDFSNAELFIGWATTVAVALSEETCFRGLVYLSLRQRFGARRAMLFAATLFTLYHWPVQPLGEWPEIFMTGVIACAALELGTGLVWIALALWWNRPSTQSAAHIAQK